VAKYLLTGILGAVSGNAGRELLQTLPDDVYCLPEQTVTAPVGRGVLRRRSREGRVDLEFKGRGGWHLVVELKIYSPLTREQIEKYTPGAPVVALVRSTASSPEVTDNERWVGAVAWETLLPTLRSLPLAAPLGEIWAALLMILEDDGDFAALPPAGTAEHTRASELLQPVADSIVQVAARELEARHGADARAFIPHLRVTDVSPYQGRRTGFYLDAKSDERASYLDSDGLIYVALRDAYDRQPILRLDWRPSLAQSLKKAQRAVDDANQQLTTEPKFAEQSKGLYRWERRVEPATLQDDVETAMTALIRAGAFDPEVPDWRSEFADD
jgi:hypothetical protein